MNTITVIILLLAKNPTDAYYSALTEKLNRVIKLFNLKLVIESELLSTKIFLAKATLKIGQKKYF